TDPKSAAIPLPLGGAKGSGLALMFECLASLLAANPILAESLEGTPASRRHYQNALVIAIDIGQFVALPAFTREITRLKKDLKALPAQPGAEILLPGERGYRNSRASAGSIKLAPAIVDELRALSSSLGIEFPGA